ncbi:MAG TPA: S8 family serine peptidase [Candidatus Krumholzibacteria bacterium]
MSNIARSAAAICAAALLLGSVLVTSASPADSYVPGELVVLFNDVDAPTVDLAGIRPTTSSPQLNAIFASHGLETASALFSARSSVKNVYLLRFPAEASLDAIVAAIHDLPFVSSVEKNWLFTVDATPDDYYFNHDWNNSGELDQWTLYKMQFNRAWEVTTGDASVIVAVIDTGLDWEHPDLDDDVVWINTSEDTNHNGVFDNYPAAQGGDINWVDNDVPPNGYVDDVIGWDFWDPDNNPYPSDGGNYDNHGTGVASIIRAETDNALGVAGGMWSTKLMPLRVGYDGYIGLAQAIGAVNYAIDNGAQVVNMSFSSIIDDTDLHAAIQAGASQGVLFVGSAGDYNNEDLRYPGAYAEVIRVAAVDSTLHKTPDSSYGTTVDISAPSALTEFHGIATCTFNPSATATMPGDDPPHIFAYNQIKTSGGAAEVTAAVALLRAAYPFELASFIKSELFRGAKPLADPTYAGKLGAGMVNPYRSLTKWGVVASDATWGFTDVSSTVYVSGDITVSEGATLTIQPGTVIKVARNDNEHTGIDTDRIEFNIEGHLIAQGTSSDPIVFDSWNSETTEDWVGFYFDSLSAGGTFNYCEIRHAEYGIESWVPLAVRNTTFDGCRYAHVASLAGGATIRGCQLFNSGSFGIYLGTGAYTTTVRNTWVNGAVGTALHLQPSESVTVRNSLFENAATAIYVSGGTANVDSTCSFYNNDIGIHFYNAGSASVVKNSIIAENTSNAILCEISSSPLIDTNTIGFNGSGIYCSNGSSPRIQRNLMQASGNAVTATSAAYPDVGHYPASGSQSIGYNSIAHTPKYVVNYNVDPIYARKNCWDKNTSPCAPSAGFFTGSVDRNSPNCCEFERWASIDPPPPPDPQELVYQLPFTGPSTPTPEKPTASGLVAIVPNPFNPSTTIHYSLSGAGNVEITVYDVAGRLVEVLVQGMQPAGPNAVVWNGTDRRGSPMASGVYFVRMTTPGQTFTQKMLLLK